MITARALPEGRPGQALAAGLTALLLALLWLGLLAPALAWYQSRQDQLALAQQRLARLAMLERGLPALRRADAQAVARAAGAQIVLPGESDAIAGANLQAALQDLAAQAGASLDSVSMLPAEPVGALRRIGAAVSLTATWPTLIALLTAIEAAKPEMIADDLAITASAQPDPRQDVTLQTSFTVAGFRAGAAP